MRYRLGHRVRALVVLAGLWAGSTAAAEPLAFSVRLDPGAAQQPLSGRLYVFLSQRFGPEPRFGPDWFRPEPFFALDVAKMAPGTSVTVGPSAEGFPGPLGGLAAGSYRVQALIDQDFYAPHHAQGVGNVYSDVLGRPLDPATSGQVELVLRNVVHEQPFPESSWRKEVRLPSQRLAAFHGREVLEPATVILPPSYDRQPERRYPVVYVIGGFDASHRSTQWLAITGPREAEPGEAEFIRVMLSGQCKWGHHVYANSATNGPRGDALVHEMIPYIDQHYRTLAAAGRFVTGHSSGGWASLWLQVNYPDTFGGVWSYAPDPVDFRDYQQVDLYARPPLSLYFDPQGARRPIARMGSTPVLWYEAFAHMDDCLGRGGQLRSFEAVFSPRGPDGLPRKLWDRTTGQIDADVARAWEQYDIRLILERNWKTLAPKLQGKLHVAVGSLDTFYLDGAVRLLGDSLRRLGSDAQVEIVRGADHGSVLSRARVRAARRQMSEACKRQ